MQTLHVCFPPRPSCAPPAPAPVAPRRDCTRQRATNSHRGFLRFLDCGPRAPPLGVKLPRRPCAALWLYLTEGDKSPLGSLALFRLQDQDLAARRPVPHPPCVASWLHSTEGDRLPREFSCLFSTPTQASPPSSSRASPAPRHGWTRQRVTDSHGGSIVFSTTGPRPRLPQAPAPVLRRAVTGLDRG